MSDAITTSRATCGPVDQRRPVGSFRVENGIPVFDGPDGGTDRMRRVDFVGFSPYRDGCRACAASLELGVFDFYEVKSCLDDLRSGHGLTFRGDRNHLRRAAGQDLGRTAHVRARWNVPASREGSPGTPDGRFRRLGSDMKSPGRLGPGRKISQRTRRQREHRRFQSM